MLEVPFTVDASGFAEGFDCIGKGTRHAVHDDVVSVLESLSVF
jgi:hypothetical protein